MTTKTNRKEQSEDSSVYYSYVDNFSALEDENKILQQTVLQLKTELMKYKANPLMVCEVLKIIDKNSAIIRIPNGNSFLVNVSVDCEKLSAGDSVLVEQKNLTIIKKTFTDKKFNVEQFVIMEKPNIKWSDLGGLKKQIEEVKEVIELPLKKPELFAKVGIQPPKGILLYGEPGTGKTLLAKAVAAATNSTFIEVVGSELVQKFIGEGAKMVHEMFDLAREKAPAIIFIDEIDSIAATRIEVGTSGEREVQRTFMQLLAEVDGFDNLDNVKIIGCTNRKDILDPAITRPGRLDRLIHVGTPNAKGRKEIFKIHSKRMKLDKVNVDKLVELSEGFTGAEIKAMCTEAGYFAIRLNKTSVTQKDFVNAIQKIRLEEESEGQDYLNMFG
jgi:proteasome regulatory subunit